MKKVSYEVAKAIKEAGYPQGMENTAWYNENGVLSKPFVFNGGGEIADAPTYIEVWLWLWREKGLILDLLHDYDREEGCFEKEVFCSPFDHTFYSDTYNDPEEAIIAAIEYLVDNDLIK